MLQFDEAWYLSKYPEVADGIRSGKWRNAHAHYQAEGQRLQYSPNRNFDEKWYCEQNPDVIQGIRLGEFKSGFDHYRCFGWTEKRATGAVEQPARIVSVDPPESNPDLYRAESSGAPIPYRAWMYKSLERRRADYPHKPAPQLLSFVTSAYNTSPSFLRAAAESVLNQDLTQQETFEWVIVDNGSSNPDTVAFLQSLQRIPFVRLIRIEANRGIIGGMRLAVQNARYRYILPVDSDDCLYPDAARILAWCIQEHHYPPVLYSDEDMIIGSDLAMPYFKPDWDPVLFANSCYVAHLCAIDRGLALMLGAYSDDRSKGCHDWDTFVRFTTAGYTPLHVPEVLYSWRVHEESCAGNIDSKDYIYSSHRNTLQRFIDSQRRRDLYSLCYSPLFNQTPDWWIRRKPIEPRKLVQITLVSGPDDCLLAAPPGFPEVQTLRLNREANISALQEIIHADWEGALVRFGSAGLRMRFEDWAWEAVGLAELFPDTVVSGGPIYSDGAVIAGGMYFGYGLGCDCPDVGRKESDPGFFAQLWKQRSVSAVPIQNSMVDAAFLLDAIASQRVPLDAPLAHLGQWLGATAARWNRRVVASPFLAGDAAAGCVSEAPSPELWKFVQANSDLMRDVRFYSVHLSRDASRPYEPA